MPLQFNTGGSPLRLRRSGDDELEVEPDGGTPLENSPVIRPAEPRDPSYTGPLYADREGGSLPTEWSL